MQISNTKILEQMLHGAIVITPNNRLSKQLLEESYKYSGKKVCEKPLCFPYQSFINHLMISIKHNLPTTKHPISLTPLQQRHLWRNAMDQHPVINEGLLDSFHESWVRCQNWGIDLTHELFQQTSATQLFQQAAQKFQNQLIKYNALAAGQHVDYILTHIKNLKLPTKLIWVAFDDITPQQNKLQQAFADYGCRSIQHEPIAGEQDSWQYAANDEQEESEQLINWLTDKLNSGHSYIGIVVPDLQSKAHSLQRFFKRHLPQYPVNFSLGLALAKQPLVAHALCWLELDCINLTPHQIRLILHSPYLGGSKLEFHQRAKLMQSPQTFQENNMPFSLVLSRFKHSVPELYALLGSIKPYPESASPAAWAECFKERLRGLGFPGEYAQNSATYQCFQRWMALFDELMPLTFLTPSITMHKALDAINALSQNTIFQPQMLQKTAVHVLGLLEASGCTFDSVWISGLTDHCLPQKTHLSPFIPIEIQRKYKMPHALPEREYALAQSLLERLQKNSSHCVMSYPRFIGELPQLPSPLITHLPTFLTTPSLKLTSKKNLIEYKEDYLLPFTNQHTLSGGISLLSRQAKCPFMAFAAHRLHARTLQDISIGLSLSERGQLIHKVMEQAWTQLKSHDQLILYSRDNLEELIRPVITDALDIFLKHRPESFNGLINQIEHARIMQITLNALDFEKKRPPFIIDALEQSFTLKLSDLELTVRIDRMDRLVQSSTKEQKTIVDYKTTLPAHKPWQEDRLEDPQLPLYALLDPDINTVMFMQLNTTGIAVSGLSACESNITGILGVKKDRSWKDYQQQWHDQLSLLAEEFKHGKCAPKPMKPSTCASCDYKSLCRVDPLKLSDFFS